MSGGKPGFVLSLRPRRYRTTAQQSAVRQAAEHCNIRKGITRAQLVRAMTECLPAYFAKKREGGEQLPSPINQEKL